MNPENEGGKIKLKLGFGFSKKQKHEAPNCYWFLPTLSLDPLQKTKIRIHNQNYSKTQKFKFHNIS